VACACLLLAGKAEESPRQLKHILDAMSNIRFAAHPQELERIQVCRGHQALLMPVPVLVRVFLPKRESADEQSCAWGLSRMGTGGCEVVLQLGSHAGHNGTCALRTGC
jgi:hypothetical protein